MTFRIIFRVSYIHDDGFAFIKGRLCLFNCHPRNFLLGLRDDYLGCTGREEYQ